MESPSAPHALDQAVSDYRRTGDVGVLLERLERIARAHATADLMEALKASLAAGIAAPSRPEPAAEAEAEDAGRKPARRAPRDEAPKGRAAKK